jgi:hypothetical protein
LQCFFFGNKRGRASPPNIFQNEGNAPLLELAVSLQERR